MQSYIVIFDIIWLRFYRKSYIILLWNLVVLWIFRLVIFFSNLYCICSFLKISLFLYGIKLPLEYYNPCVHLEFIYREFRVRYMKQIFLSVTSPEPGDIKRLSTDIKVFLYSLGIEDQHECNFFLVLLFFFNHSYHWI